MISLHELITLFTLIVSIVFLFFFYQLDRIKSSYYHYIYSLLFVVILISVFDLLVSAGRFQIAMLIFPVYISAYFFIYPLFYLYALKLVFTGKELKGKRQIWYYLYPVLAVVLSVVLYLPLSPEARIHMVNWLFVDPTVYPDAFNYLTLFSLLYYLQFAVYIFLFVKLYRAARLNMSDRIIDKNVVLIWLRYFLITIISYEIIVAVLIYAYPNAGFEAFIQFLSLVLILFLGVLRINQSIIEIQTRLRKAKLNLDQVGESTKQYLIEPEEKTDLMNLIEKTLREKKLFTDPNLTIDQFAKVIHASSRKLSIVINEITGNSFSQLLNAYRIETAQKMLSSSEELSIEEIYERSGFNSRSTFYRVFKSFTGCTPKEYQTNPPTEESN